MYLGIFFDLGIYLIFLVFQRFFLNIRNPHNLLISVSSFRLLFRVAYARLMNPIFFSKFNLEWTYWISIHWILDELNFFFISLLSIVKLWKKNRHMEFYSPSFLHILITKIKKKEMIKHLGINDLILLIDLLKNQTIEYLSQVPQRDTS